MSKGKCGSFHLWINVWVAGKTVCPSLTRAIPERFRDESLIIKHYTNLWIHVLYFTIISQLCDLFSNMQAHVGRQALRKKQKKQLDVQHCAVLVIFGNIPYDIARRSCNIPSLAERWHKLGRSFFQSTIGDKSNVLWYLLPAKHNVQLMIRLRHARQCPAIYAQTDHYKNSFYRIWTKPFAVTCVVWFCVCMISCI